MANQFMQIALNEARKAADRGEVPIGAVIVLDDKIIAQAGNETRARPDATAHAEILVMRQASILLNAERLIGCDLYVTLEPCTMCAAAISFARIRRLYYGPFDPKGGGISTGARFFNQPSCFHKPEIYEGIGAEKSSALLKAFFAEKRR